jgi:hypothetical protein
MMRETCFESLPYVFEDRGRLDHSLKTFTSFF